MTERSSATSLPSGALRRPSELQRFALGVLLLLAAFAVIYLVAANVILRTRFLRDTISRGPDTQLEYDSAYSVWPGLVHVRGLSLQVQSYRHQLSIDADSGLIKLSLTQLALRHFHATHVSLQGLSFRLRERVHPGWAHSRRVLAFPPIAGFAEPALLPEKPPEPIPDADYDLWQVQLEDVRAELRELWFSEYHYLGGGQVRGGFMLQPGRHFAVYPAHVTLERGELGVGEALAATRVRLDLTGYIEPTDVRAMDTRSLVEKISGRVSLEAHGLSFAALDSYAPLPGRPRTAGKGELTLDASVSRGRLEPHATARLDASSFSLATPLGKLSGALHSALQVLPDGSLDWVTSSPRLSLQGSGGQRGPVLSTPRLALGLYSASLGAAPELRRAELDVTALDVPSLGWAQRRLERAGIRAQLAGRLTGAAHLSFAPPRGPSARIELRLADAQLNCDALRASMSGRIAARLEPAEREHASSGRVDIELDGVQLARPGEDAKPFRAALHLPDVALALEPEPGLSTSLEVSAQPADSLLGLALGSPILEGLVGDVFALKTLDARARLKLDERALRLELSRAQSGGLAGSGFWQRPSLGDARGAFLVSSKLANVGISLSGAETDLAWFVADDWLSRARGVPGLEQRVSGQDRPARSGARRNGAAHKR